MINFGLFVYLNNEIETSFIIIQKIGLDTEISILLAKHYIINKILIKI